MAINLREISGQIRPSSDIAEDFAAKIKKTVSLLPPDKQKEMENDLQEVLSNIEGSGTHTIRDLAERLNNDTVQNFLEKHLLSDDIAPIRKDIQAVISLANVEHLKSRPELLKSLSPPLQSLLDITLSIETNAKQANNKPESYTSVFLETIAHLSSISSAIQDEINKDILGKTLFKNGFEMTETLNEKLANMQIQMLNELIKYRVFIAAMPKPDENILKILVANLQALAQSSLLDQSKIEQSINHLLTLSSSQPPLHSLDQDTLNIEAGVNSTLDVLKNSQLVNFEVRNLSEAYSSGSDQLSILLNKRLRDAKSKREHSTITTAITNFKSAPTPTTFSALKIAINKKMLEIENDYKSVLKFRLSKPQRSSLYRALKDIQSDLNTYTQELTLTKPSPGMVAKK